MIFNTSSAEVLDLVSEQSTHQALIRQILYAALGSFLALVFARAGYKTLLKLSFPLLLLATFLLALVFVPTIGVRANGALRWIGVAGYTFQPSEFAKFIIPLYFVQVALEHREEGVSFSCFLRTMAWISLPLLLILMEPDNGTVGIIVTSLLAAFFITGVRLRYWALPMLVIVLIAGVFAAQSPYVQGRLKVYWNPEADLLGKGHQPHQAKIASGSGGVLGRGPGKSVQKLSYLPEAQNDYIAAIFAEEFGFLGVITLILLYMLIAYLGFYIAIRSSCPQGMYSAGLLTFILCFQAFLNLGVVSGLLPSTGLNLPFFSQGGTSLMSNIVAIGVLLNVAEA